MTQIEHTLMYTSSHLLWSCHTVRAIDGHVFLNTRTPSTLSPSSSYKSNGRAEDAEQCESRGKRYLPGHRVEQSSLDAEERHRRRTRLAFDGTRKRGNDDGAGLCLEERVDDGCLLPSDVVVEPMPRLGVDGLADGADDAQRAQVGVLHVRFAESSEETDGGGRGVEVRELVLVDRLPEARRCRVDGRRLENRRGDAVRERAVDEVTAVCSSEYVQEA